MKRRTFLEKSLLGVLSIFSLSLKTEAETLFDKKYFLYEIKKEIEIEEINDFLIYTNDSKYDIKSKLYIIKK